MTPEEARTIVLGALARVAPEIDGAAIDPQAELQVEADLDSMDFLHLVEEVSTATGRDIPERDYPALATLDGFVGYVTAPPG